MTTKLVGPFMCVLCEKGEDGALVEVQRLTAHLPEVQEGELTLVSWGDHVWEFMNFRLVSVDESRSRSEAVFAAVDVFSMDHEDFQPMVARVDADSESHAKLQRFFVGAEDREKDWERLGEQAFNTYNGSGAKPWVTFDGRPVPKWGQVTDDVRAKWIAAAKELVLDETARRRAAVSVLEETMNIMKSVFSLRDHLSRQAGFSLATFGPGTAADRVAGIVDHIQKELHEVQKNPHDVFEWIDIAILAFDGAMRIPGMTGAGVEMALRNKQKRNEGRTWPDWRTAAPGKAIEHVRHEGVTGTPSGGPGLDVSGRAPDAAEQRASEITSGSVLASALSSVLPEAAAKLNAYGKVKLVKRAFDFLAKLRLRATHAQQVTGGSVDFVFAQIAAVDEILNAEGM